MERCEVCQGRRVIRLPLYKPVNYFPEGELVPVMSMDETSREYPCPECGTKASVEKVFALDAYVAVDNRIPDHSLPHVRRTAAHKLVDRLLDGGLIEFEKGREDRNQMRFPMIATVWVVHPGEARRSIEARVRQRQDQLAKAVAEEAIRSIAIWGMHYGLVEVRKEDAARFVREALKKVSESWSKEDELRARGEMVG